MEINIPTSLKDITMRQFIAFEKSDKTDDDYIIHLCEFANPKLLSIKDYNEIVSILKEVMQGNVTFEKTFNYKSISFGFIPNLDLISTDEFMHLEEYLKNPDTFNKALAVLYRPVIKQKRNWFKKNSHELYDILPYKEENQFEELFLDVSCSYYLGAMVFFYDLGNDLLKYMQDYSVQLESKKKKKANLMKSGDGMLVLEH